MKKKNMTAAVIILLAVLIGGCSGKSDIQKMDDAVQADAPVETISESDKEPAKLTDGVYTAEFITDSSMFRVNETCEGKGILTVENGEMTIHISLGSKNIVNLYPGLAEDAEKEGAELLMPTEDPVTYSDGITEEVYGFDVPIPYLEEEFDLALIGTKGKWYDHKVSVSAPVPVEEGNGISLKDGTYHIEITFEGGSGKAQILSPVTIVVTDGQAAATLQWSSPNYDYMIVDGKKYLPVNTEGNSVFEIPVLIFDEPVTVIGDTVAMSKPHEVEYTLTFHSETIKEAEMNLEAGQESGAELVYERSMDIRYAENFKVDYYEGGYVLLTTTIDGARFLIVPEDKEIPVSPGKGILGGDVSDDEVIVLQRPVKDLYLVASSAMDAFSELDGLEAITFSGQKEEGWYIDVAREAMERGDILYAGKYNKPDYELIVSNHCMLAIENTMISHSPEVIEKLNDFGIPVMIEYSSYESHPLGRVEWVKFYGALLGKEEKAEKIFEAQMEILERVSREEKTDKTVAFFFITSNGLVQVRQSSDYVPKMIELAGGTYIFKELGDPKAKSSTLNMQIEEFYAGAKDADFLIYNSSIDGGISGVEELIDKCGVLADFKAVKEGNVWCTTNDMYQQPLSIGYLMEDLSGMLRGKKDEMHYLFPVD